MQKHNLLADKSILGIDPDLKKENDKTFCFWATETDEIFKDYESIISNQWNSIQINDFEAQSIVKNINNLMLKDENKVSNLIINPDLNFLNNDHNNISKSINENKKSYSLIEQNDFDNKKYQTSTELTTHLKNND